MNNESITREDLIIKLQQWVDDEVRPKTFPPGGFAKAMTNYIFPPFEPKEGEVIAVRHVDIKKWGFRKFIQMNGGGYKCEDDVFIDLKHTWKFARPLTDKEKGS